MAYIEKRRYFQFQCNVIVNTVNCVGAIGKEIALKLEHDQPVLLLSFNRVNLLY